MKPYQPIDCNFYDILEATAVKRKVVKIEYSEAEELKTIQTRILDLYTLKSVEYAVLENNLTIRLDQLISVDGEKLDGFCAI